MYHLVYKTIVRDTGQYYIGVHSTHNLDDAYFGSGIKIKHILSKRGSTALQREIIYSCTSREEAFAHESTILTESVLADPLCLNLTRGGKGNSNEHTLSTREKIGRSAKGRNAGKRYSLNSSSEQLARRKELGKLTRPSEAGKQKLSQLKLGKKLSEQTRKKMSESKLRLYSQRKLSADVVSVDIPSALNFQPAAQTGLQGEGDNDVQ